MGGCGFCNGLGAKATLAKLQYVPANVGLSLVHSSLKARMYWSLTAPRLSYGGGADGLELLTHPADAAADDKSALGEHVDGRQDFCREYGRTVRHQHD